MIPAKAKAILTTPWDWSDAITPREFWIDPNQNLSDLFYKNGFTLTERPTLYPWSVRLHAYAQMSYLTQLFHLQATEPAL
jgi:hypothetical protein